MNYILVFIFIWQAKLIKLATLILKKGNATSLPGLFIETKFPALIRNLASSYKEVIVISGTNGKTTTRSILTKMYKQGGFKVCTNLGGANIYRGIATALLLDKTWLLKTKSDILILEIEEATLPKISLHLKVDKIILTNLFRDQLDLYGEIDQTLNYFKKSLKILDNPNLKIILNADDGKLVSLRKLDLKAHFYGFSLNIPEESKPQFEDKSVVWLSGSNDLESYSQNSLVNSLGNKLQNNQQNNLWIIQPVAGLNAPNTSNNQNLFKIIKAAQKSFEEVELSTQLEGNYNLYNCIAAIIAAESLGLEVLQKSLLSQAEVFGRGEDITIKGAEIKIILVKNPASFNQVLDWLSTKYSSLNLQGEASNFVFLINDKIADGRDVSWLWDIQFEKYLPKIKTNAILTGGSRGLDMLLRLEYSKADVLLENNFDNLELLLKSFESNQKYTILCTYTAMTELREILSSKVELKKINDESF